MANFDEFDVVDLPEVDETFVEKVNKNSGWRIGTDIVPSVFYQAYFEDGAWNADDESTYRLYIEEPSEVKPEVVKPKAAAAEEGADEPAADGDNADAPADGQSADPDAPAADPDANASDPAADPSADAGADAGADADAPADSDADAAADESEEEVDRELPLLKANKYCFAKPYEVVRLEITPSASLKEEYPYAIVVIDGKEYDLGILDNPIRFVMSKDHRVVLDWKHGEVYESFRIVVNR